MGIVFVAVEFLLLFMHFYNYRKNALKTLIRYSLLFTVFAIPYLVLFCSYLYASNHAILDPFIWSKTDFFYNVFIK